MKRMHWVRVAAVLLVAAGVNACGGNGGTGDADKREITFLTFESPNLTTKYWDSAIKRITDEHPDLSVKRLTAPSAGDRTNYAQQLLDSGQFPDVMVGIPASDFAADGNLAEWSKDELKDFVVPSAGLINGKVYQLPANTQAIPLVYYNRKLFADAGIAHPPTTWSELLAASAALKARGTPPFVIGGGKDAFASGLLLTGTVGTDVYAAEPDWMSRRRADRVRFADAAFVKAAGKVADLARLGYVDKGDLSRDYAATEQAFLDYKGAMYPMGNWFASAADTKKPTFDIGVFAFPGDTGNHVVSAYTGGGLTVNAKSKTLAAAKEFALACQLDKVNLDNSVKADGLIPAIKGYQPPADVGPVYRAGYDLYQQAVRDDAVVAAFNWESADDSPLPGMSDKIWAGAQDLISGSRTPEQVGAALDADWSVAGSPTAIPR